MLPSMHATRTESGIEIPDPDQGAAYLNITMPFPSTDVRIWEPFGPEEVDADPKLANAGHNLFGFVERWERWAAGDAPFLRAFEPRFGHPVVLMRPLLEHACQVVIMYHRREDVRAGHRLAVPGQPTARRLADGAIEISVPR